MTSAQILGHTFLTQAVCTQDVTDMVSTCMKSQGKPEVLIEDK